MVFENSLDPHLRSNPPAPPDPIPEPARGIVPMNLPSMDPLLLDEDPEPLFPPFPGHREKLPRYEEITRQMQLLC
jgi:hypothetical protein